VTQLGILRLLYRQTKKDCLALRHKLFHLHCCQQDIQWERHCPTIQGFLSHHSVVSTSNLGLKSKRMRLWFLMFVIVTGNRNRKKSFKRC